MFKKRGDGSFSAKVAFVTNKFLLDQRPIILQSCLFKIAILTFLAVLYQSESTVNFSLGFSSPQAVLIWQV